MPRVRLLLAAVLAASSLVFVTSPAFASAPARNNKFCNAVNKISSQVKGGSTSSSTAQSKALAKSVDKAAKSAPSSVKSAMRTMADYFRAIASAGSNADRLSSVAKKAPDYAKAVTKFEGYFISHCVGTS